MSARLHFSELGGRGLAALRRRAGAPALEAAALERGTELGLALWDGERLAGWWLAARDGKAGAAPRVQVLGAGVAPAYGRQFAELVGRGVDRAQHAQPGCVLQLARGAGDADSHGEALAALLPGLGYRAAASSAAAEAGARFEPCGEARPDAWRELPVLAEQRWGGHSYALRAVRCEAHWAPLEAEWQRLLGATPGASVFQSFAVQRAWWQCFGARRRLWIVLIASGERLLGIAPLQLSAVRGPLGTRCVLSFLGGLPEVHRPTFLFGGQAEACAPLLLAALEDGLEPWDELDLHEQPRGSPFGRALCERLAAARCFTRSEPDATAPFLPLAGSFDDYFASCSSAQRSNVRSAQRKLESRGSLEYRVCAEPAEWPAALERYRELERRSWKHGDPCSVSDPRRAPFFAALLQWLAPRRGLEIAFLELDGHAIAATISLLAPPRFTHLEICYDAELGKLSPGMVLQYLELRAAFERGFTEYDFLGGNLEHKRRWSPALRETERLYARRPSAGAALQYAWLLGVRPHVQRALAHSGGLERARQLHASVRDRLRRVLEARAPR